MVQYLDVLVLVLVEFLVVVFLEVVEEVVVVVAVAVVDQLVGHTHNLVDILVHMDFARNLMYNRPSSSS